jgi:ferredoxin
MILGWKIKHPTLRNYRYKTILKDIFSRERMKRFGMIDSEQCEICGACETVQHQLFDCPNALKIRQFASNIMPGFNVNDLYSLIQVGNDKKCELLKCIIIKFLIQIDRSKGATFEMFQQQYTWYSIITAYNGANASTA